MSHAKARLSAIAYSVGAAIPVDTLREAEGIEEPVIASLKQRGLQSFRKETCSTADMCASSVRATLREASMTARDIDAIVFANSNAEWNLAEETEFLAALSGLGFSKTLLMGLSLQSCSGCSAALGFAAHLIEGRRATTVLVILCGRRRALSRIAPQATTLFSDGAVSCIVSTDAGQFELLANESATNPDVVVLDQSSPSPARLLQMGFQDLKDVMEKVYTSSTVKPEGIRALLGTNGSLVYLHLMAQAARLPQSKIYSDGLSQYGHVHSCDNLIGLKDFVDRSGASEGDCFLLVGWSPYIVGASLVRSVSSVVGRASVR